MNNYDYIRIGKIEECLDQLWNIAMHAKHEINAFVQEKDMQGLSHRDAERLANIQEVVNDIQSRLRTGKPEEFLPPTTVIPKAIA